MERYNLFYRTVPSSSGINQEQGYSRSQDQGYVYPGNQNELISAEYLDPEYLDAFGGYASGDEDFYADTGNNMNGYGIVPSQFQYQPTRYQAEAAEDLPEPEGELGLDNEATEYTPATSATSSQSQSESESVRYPSQGSDFFCPASPTYSLSLPSNSQPQSQGSGRSLSPSSAQSSLVPNSDNQYLSLDYSGFNLSGNTSGSESGGSQPEVKRMRFEFL